MNTEDFLLCNGTSPTKISATKIIPIEFLPDDTIAVSPKVFKQLTGKTPEEVFAERATDGEKK